MKRRFVNLQRCTHAIVKKRLPHLQESSDEFRRQVITERRELNRLIGNEKKRRKGVSSPHLSRIASAAGVDAEELKAEIEGEETQVATVPLIDKEASLGIATSTNTKDSEVHTVVTSRPETPDNACVQRVDERLLSDNLLGVGFAEWMGSEDQWEKTVRRREDWLKGHPEDIFCRGMLLWSGLTKGNPREMVEVLKETARWLVPDLLVPSNPNFQSDSNFSLQEIDKKIGQIKNETVEVPGFVRMQLAGTLVRATLLRWLRFQGKSSQLESEFASLGDALEQHVAFKHLFDSTKSQRGDSWVATAVELVSRWVGYDPESGLAQLCLLWFTGRQGEPDRMQFAIGQSCHWLERNPNHSLVRWATIWLAGLCPEGESIVCLIDEFAKWLGTEKARDDRLVRMGFLWLVGAIGSPGQVRRAITQTAKWIKANPKDDFIHVAYLLFLIMRRGTCEQRKMVITETRNWLRSNSDFYKLTAVALRLFETAPD